MKKELEVSAGRTLTLQEIRDVLYFSMKKEDTVRDELSVQFEKDEMEFYSQHKEFIARLLPPMEKPGNFTKHTHTHEKTYIHKTNSYTR